MYPSIINFQSLVLYTSCAKHFFSHVCPKSVHHREQLEILEVTKECSLRVAKHCPLTGAAFDAVCRHPLMSTHVQHHV